MKKYAVAIIAALCVMAQQAPGCAQENTSIVAVSKVLLEADERPTLIEGIEEVKELYYDDGRFGDFVDFLDSLAQKKKAHRPLIDYYVALTRYRQLRHLEENQLWDEYFEKGNSYRDDITERAQRTIDAVLDDDPYAVYARVVLWEFHHYQQDAFVDEARNAVTEAVEEYVRLGALDAQPIKAAADRFLAGGERARSKQLYRLYIEKLSTKGMDSEEIKAMADAFRAEGNLELAASIYDLFIVGVQEELSPADAAARMLEVARQFVYRPEGDYDTAYAESVFERIEDLLTKEALSEEILYERAMNLQHAHEYVAAKECYEQILISNPQTALHNEARFKIGMTTAYAMRNLEGARAHFERAVESAEADAHLIASLYQLALLDQWEGNNEQAAARYSELIEKAGREYADTVDRAQARLQEIEEQQDLAYNLKTFLDLSFLTEHSRMNMTRVRLRSTPSITAVDEDVLIEATAVLGPTGCFQVDVQYLWSGHTGSASVDTQTASWHTSFPQTGTKEVNGVVVSPTGFVDRYFVLIDVL